MEWQPIETAPSMKYLLLWDGYRIYIGCFHTFNGGKWVYMGNLLPVPTHWMAFPDAPKG